MDETIQLHVELLKNRKIKVALFRLYHVITDFALIENIAEKHRGEHLEKYLKKYKERLEILADIEHGVSPAKWLKKSYDKSSVDDYNKDMISSYFSEYTKDYKESSGESDHINVGHLLQTSLKKSENEHRINSMILSRKLIRKLAESKINVIVYEYYDFLQFYDGVSIEDIVRYIVGDDSIYTQIIVMSPPFFLESTPVTINNAVIDIMTTQGQHLHDNILTLSHHNKFDIFILKTYERHFDLMSSEIILYGHFNDSTPYLKLGVNVLNIDGNLGLQCEDITHKVYIQNNIFYNFTNSNQVSHLGAYNNYTPSYNRVVVIEEAMQKEIKEFIDCLLYNAPTEPKNNFVIILTKRENNRSKNVIYRNIISRAN